MTQAKEIQSLARMYKDDLGLAEIDVDGFAEWMVRKGWPLPPPVAPMERLARTISSALRVEERYDATTGLPYRANHAYPVGTSRQGTLWSWIDIDEAPREPMRKALQHRRDQMVDDGFHLSLDTDHWNAINPHEKPIVVQLDFTDDIEWRKNAPDENSKAS